MLTPSPKEAAEYFSQVARECDTRGNKDLARFAYRNGVQSWYEATLHDPSCIERLRDTEDEFSEFARKDPKYVDILKIVKGYAIQYPGIKESVLCSILDRFQPDDLNYVLHFGQKHGEILQTSKGEIFELNTPPDLTHRYEL